MWSLQLGHVSPSLGSPCGLDPPWLVWDPTMKAFHSMSARRLSPDDGDKTLG